jgi:hypothetical protein
MNEKPQIDVFDVANAQIDQVEREHTRPGWSIWAVLVALCSALWMLSLEIQQHGFPQKEHFRIAIAVYLFIAFVRAIATIGDLQHPTNKSEIRLFSSASLYHGSRRTLAFEIVVTVAILVIALQNQMLSSWRVSFLWLYCVGYLLLLTTALVMSLVNLPVVVSGRKPRPFLTGTVAVYYLLTTICLSAFLLARVDVKTVTSMIFLRSVGLLVAIAILAEFLVKFSKTNPLLKALEQIRDDLSFERITPQEAKERISVITNGFKLEQALQADISRLMNYIHEETSLFTTLRERFNLIFEKTKRGRLRIGSKGLSETTMAIMDSIKYLVDKARGTEQKMRPLNKKITRRLSIIAAQSINREEIFSLERKILKELAAMDEISNSFISDLDSAEKVLKMRLSGRMIAGRKKPQKEKGVEGGP